MSDKKLISIDNLDKISKGLDARYKEMIQDETERASTQEQLLKTELNATKDMFGGKSIRYITQAEYDVLSEAEKNSLTITYFITDAKDTSHEHENKEFLDNLAARNIAIGNKVQTFDGVNDLSYSISDIGAAPASHTHDGRYYTETEINGKIEDINEAINTNVATLQASINGKAPSSHTHDDRYYTETEINTKVDSINETINTKEAALNSSIATAKSGAISESKSYTDTAISKLIDSAPDAMNTLNELAKAINDHQDEYETYVNTVSTSVATAKAEAIAEAAKKDTALHTTISAEIDADVKAEKDRAMEAEADLQAAINGKAASGHNHDDRYYTETEMNGKIEDINTTINKKEAALNSAIEGKAPKNHTHTVLTMKNDNFKKNSDLPSSYERGETLFFSNSPATEDRFNSLTYGLVQTLKEYSSGSAAWQFLYPYNASNDKFYVRNAQYSTDSWRSWAEVYTSLNKPTPADIGAAASSHSHDDRYYTESEMNTKLSGKSDTGHTHDDRYYTETEINGKIEDINETINTKEAALQASINGKAPSSHTHDDRYYTESEVDNKLAAKADSKHGNHVPATQTANNATFLRNDNSWQKVTPANIGAAPASHNHDSLYYTEAEVDGLIEDINGVINTNVANLTTEINKKLNASDHGAHLALGTTSSTAFRGDQGLTAYNHSQTAHAPANAQKNSDITKAEIEAKLTGSITSHNHGGQYYTKTEINGKIDTINGSISSNVSTLEGKIATAKSGAISESKSYTDTAITNLVDSAPEAMNTLNELAEAISNHQDEYEAYINTVSTNIATAKSEAIAEAAKKDTALHTTISAEIDADVKVEKERAEAAESALQTAINGKAASGHTHDDRYYTESEMNTKLAAKADSKHGNHVPDTQTANNATFLRNDNTWQKVTPANIGAAASSHNHDDRYFTETEINGLIEDINETINTKEAALQASIKGKANSSHNHTSVNKTMITTPIYNPNSGVLVDFNINVKSGAMVILKLYGNSYSTNPPIEAIYQFYDYAGGDIQNCTGSAISGPSITLKVYKADGKLKAWFQQPNDYCTFKLEVAYGNNSSTPNITLTNAAEPTTNITQTVTITPDRIYSKKYKPTASDIGAAASGHNHDDRYFTESEANNAFAPKSHNHDDNYYTESEIDTKVSNLETAIGKKANSSHGTHVTWATNAPKANGTAAVGTVARVAREDHVHPLQESVSGNAGSANKVNKALKIQLNGGTTEGTNQFLFDGSTAKNINITAGNIGASASGHTHDDRYYTKTNINDKIEDINETITSKEAALQASINGKAASSHGSHVAYGTCSTAAATAAKVVSVSDTSWKLTTGCIVAIKFTTSNTAGSVTLNVNSSGAYPIWYNNAAYTGTSNKYTGYANRVITYMFNGTHWVWITGGTDDNNTYTNASLGQGYATCSTAEATVAKVGTLSNYSLQQGGVVSVKFTYNVPASATLNINSKGAKAIYFRGAAITANIIKAGDIATFMYDGSQYQLISIDRWQNDITSHTHDGRYYTETEINNKIADINTTINTEVAKLNGDIAKKANSSHGTHVPTPQTANNAKFLRNDNSWQTVTPANIGAAASSHGNHVPATQTASNKVFLRNDNTWATVTPANIGAAASSHTHDDRYYTETEINGKIEDINTTINNKEAALQASINGKAASGHSHSVINPQDTRAVNTSPKDVPNGLSVHLKSNGTDGLSDGGTYHSTLMIKGWNDKSGGPWSQLAITQNNNLYFRSSVASSDTDWNAWKKVSLDGHTHSSYQPKDNTISTVSVSNGKLTLTKAKRQKCTNITSGTQIVFPTVGNTEFLEIHLYFNAESDMSLTLPDCKWRVDPNLEAGKSYELVATWNTMNWLANLIVYS